MSALSALKHLLFNLTHVTGSNKKKDCQKELGGSVQIILSGDY